MIDVPITIFFCTNKKFQSFIDQILADRDQVDEGPQTDRDTQEDRNSLIDRLISSTINKYAPFRNIHVMLGNDERTLAEYKKTMLQNEQSKILDSNTETIPMVPVRQPTDKHPRFECKFLESGTEIIFETDEEDLESKVENSNHSSNVEDYKGFVMSRKQTIIGRDRANTRTDEDWNNLMQKLYMSRNATLCSNMSADSEILKEESKESLKEEGE